MLGDIGTSGCPPRRLMGSEGIKVFTMAWSSEKVVEEPGGHHTLDFSLQPQVLTGLCARAENSGI